MGSGRHPPPALLLIGLSSAGGLQIPHFIVEYTANLENELALDTLFANVHRQLIAKQLFPTGGIRSLARRIEHYCFADGLGDYAGVHVELKLSATRPQALREEIGRKYFRHSSGAFCRSTGASFSGVVDGGGGVPSGCVLQLKQFARAV